MPRSGQIIPQYLHPHDEVYINDNTVYTDYTDDNTGIVQYLCLFPSPKGRDKLMTFNNLSKWVNEYGLPNFRVFGQLPYLPYVLLSTGLTKVTCMRLTAKDSTYANLILVAHYKEDGGKLKLKFSLHAREGLRNADDLDTIANAMETTRPDEDGYRSLPIATFWSIGRGLYGTDFRVRITHDKGADRDNEFKNYQLAVLSTEDGASLLEKFNVSFYIDAIDPLTNKTIYVEDVVNDEDGNGSQKINMHFFPDNYQKLFDEYVRIYEESESSVETTKVDRLPGVTLPSTTTVYNLTANDGSFTPGLYVYNGETGLFAASTYTIENVTAIPSIASVLAGRIYKATTDLTVTEVGAGGATTTTTWAAGSCHIVNTTGDAFIEIAVEDVAKLPSTTVYELGVIYELTAADGDKAAGTLWTFDTTAGDYVAYTPSESSEEKDPLDLTIATWDMFGYNRVTEEEDEHMVIDGDDSLVIMDTEGVSLLMGSDGSLSEETDTATRNAALEASFKAALDGEVDRLILSTRRTPFHQMYDANLNVNLKKAMVAFCLKRKDFALHLDCGLLQTTSDLKQLVTSMGTIDTYLVSVDSGMLYTLDPMTGKNIPVSILLWMAQAYPVHVDQNGWHTPFAGERYAIVTGYTSNKKIKPVYDEELDADILEDLYAKYRINYLQCLDDDTFVRGTQITCQHKTSDLSKENNVMLTLEIKRKIERMISKNRYNWTEAAELKMFQEDCQQIFSSYAGNKCRSLTVKVAQTDWERTRYILHAYLEVVFRKYQERGIVEIDLNPS